MTQKYVFPWTFQNSHHFVIPKPSDFAFSPKFQSSKHWSLKVLTHRAEKKISWKKKFEKKNGRVIGNEVFARTGTVCGERRSKLLGVVRGTPTPRPEPRGLEESARAQEGDCQALGSPPHPHQPLRGMFRYLAAVNLEFWHV